MSRPPPGTPGPTAFVLAGGGSLGAIQVGMLKALAEEGIVPDLVVGSSVGALNGAFFAGEPDLHGASKLERLWRGLRRSQIFPLSPFSGIASLLGLRDHLIDPARLHRLIRAELPFRRLERAQVPCHFVATNALDGSEYVMSSGPAVRSLMASAAIPGIFPPVTLGRRRLIDGGIADNTPVSTAVTLGARRIVILPTGLSCALRKLPRSALALALHALNILIMRRLVDDLERFADRAELITLPPPCPVRVTAYDFSQSPALIERSEAECRRWLRRHGLRSRGTPESLLPHAHG